MSKYEFAVFGLFVFMFAFLVMVWLVSRLQESLHQLQIQNIKLRRKLEILEK